MQHQTIDGLEHLKHITDTIQRWLRNMSTMISEAYDALKAVAVPNEKARAAAQAVAQYDKDIAELKAGQMPLKWMVGFNLAFTMEPAHKLKIPELG